MCCKVLGKQKYLCSHHESLLKSLGVNLSSDNPEIHPQYFCNYCYLSAKKHMCGQQSCTLSPTQWLPHSDTCCTVCDVRSKGGRPKKKSSSGRPSSISIHIRSVALPISSFTLDQVVDNNYIDDVTCSSYIMAYHGGSFIGNHTHKALKVNGYLFIFFYSFHIA